MEVQVCVACMMPGESLSNTSVPWSGAGEMLFCSYCAPAMKKLNLFYTKCLRVESLLKEYSSTRHLHQSFEAFLQSARNTMHTAVKLGASNTLCIDTTPTGTRVTSYYRGSLLSGNYSEGMVSSCRKDTDKQGAPTPAGDGGTSRRADARHLGGSFVVPFGASQEMKNDKPTEFERIFVCRSNLSHEEQMEEMERRKSSQEYRAAPHKCTLCYTGFKFLYSLDNHMKKHSQESGPVECSVCQQRFKTPNKQREHVRSHHSQVMQCLVCGRRIKERKRLKEHWESHQGHTYTCNTCARGFRTKAALIQHMGVHTNRFPCSECSLVLHSRPTFRKHLLLHSAVRPFACTSCPKSYATREWLELHTQRAHAPPTDHHYCVECDYRFKSSREYKKHLTAKKHTPPSLLVHSCPKCPRQYATQDELRRHTSALHDRILTYSCTECSAGFATGRGLYGHKRRVHQGYVAPKKYTCDYCGKAFRDKYYLSSHVKVHAHS